MAIALRLGSDGQLQNFQVGESLQIDEIDRLGSGDLTIGASLGALDELILGSVTGLVHALGDVEVDGTINTVTIDSDGNIYMDANGSSTATPRIFGALNFSVGEAIRWEFGDVANAIQNSNGGSMTLYSHHTMILKGDRNTTALPGFDTESDIGVWIPNTTPASPALVIDGAAAQTGDLLQLRDSAGTVLSGFDSAGNYELNDKEIEGISHAPTNYTETADTLNGHLDGIDAALSANGSVFCIWAEEAAGLADGAYEWSFGNGDEVVNGSGVVVPFACEVFAMALDHNTASSATVRFQINGTNVDDVTTTAERNAFTNFGTPHAVAAGDVIGFQTVTGTGSSGGNRVMVWLRANGSVVAGGVTGPDGATDEAIARYDTTTGKLLQNSNVTINDDGDITLVDTAEIRFGARRAILGSGDTLLIGQDTGGDLWHTVDLEAVDKVTFSINGATVAQFDADGLEMNNSDVYEIRTATYNGVQAHGGMGATETIDWSAGQIHSGTNSANSTLSFTDPPGPGHFSLILTNGGAFTIAWPAAVEWPDSTEPTWTASGVDVISFLYDGTTYYGMTGQNFG